jgi:hypothetical protein
LNIRFTWDSAKAKRNLRKHKVSFDTAQQVFRDPYLIIAEDCEDERGEMRYHAVGYAERELLLLVVFVDHSSENEEIIHIISARKAEKNEQTPYTDQFA